MRIPGSASLLLTAFAAGCQTGAPGGGPNVPPPSTTTGILVTTPEGATGETYDVFTADAATLLEQAEDTGEVFEIDPGTYLLTDYFNPNFVFARDVVVSAGQVTTVPLGAIEVTTVAGSEPDTYDIYDASGSTLLSQANETDAGVPVPPGEYVLTEYFNDVFVYAAAVRVEPDQITTIQFGAVVLDTPQDTTITYDVYAEDGATLLTRGDNDGLGQPLPAGTYTFTGYFNEALVYAADVEVAAGELVTIELGAIRYTGPEPSYDLYDSTGALVSRALSANENYPVPPGTYVIKDYFSNTVLVEEVVVEAGEITTTP